MELRTLRYFLAVAQEGNITRAADILHLTQPTLSRQIMDLERELGVTLMLRGKNGLTLTDDGTFFRQRAQEIVELADRLEKNFAQRQGSVSGMVVIGASETAGGQTLAKLIRKFSEKYPAVQFSLYNETVDNIKDRLDKGLADIGLLLEPIDVTKYDYVRLARQDTWGLLVRGRSPADRKDVADGGRCGLLPADPAAARKHPGGDSALAGARGKANCASRCFTRCCPTPPCWWPKGWAALSAWTARWPSAAIRACGSSRWSRAV